MSAGMAGGCTAGGALPRLDQTLAEAVDQLTVGRRQSEEQAIDRFDDHAPLRETSDGAERVQARLHFDRHADTELRIVLDLLACSSSSRRTAHATTLSYSFVGHARTFLGHGRTRRRGTAEICRLQRASDTCQQQ